MTFTSKGLATRARIIEETADFLRSIEFTDLTLDDVRAATRTSKGQLFHYFPDGKEELLLAVMRREADRVLSDQEPHLSALSSWRAWEEWREVVIARYRAQGSHCPLNSLVGQIGTTPGVDEVTRALLTRWQEHIATGVREMQSTGLVRATLEADRFAGAVVAGIQGGVVVMWSTGNTDHLEAILDVLFAALREEGDTTASGVRSAAWQRKRQRQRRRIRP